MKKRKLTASLFGVAAIFGSVMVINQTQSFSVIPVLDITVSSHH